MVNLFSVATFNTEYMSQRLHTHSVIQTFHIANRVNIQHLPCVLGSRIMQMLLKVELPLRKYFIFVSICFGDLRLCISLFMPCVNYYKNVQLWRLGGKKEARKAGR